MLLLLAAGAAANSARRSRAQGARGAAAVPRAHGTALHADEGVRREGVRHQGAFRSHVRPSAG